MFTQIYLNSREEIGVSSSVPFITLSSKRFSTNLWLHKDNSEVRLRRNKTTQIQHFEFKRWLTNDDIENINEDIDSISREDDHKLLIEDASYGLKVRSKEDKLSVDQATFIKDLSWDLSTSTRDIWRAYNVSLSVVNKIKRSSYFQLNRPRTKRIVKHYGTQKVKFITSIKDFWKRTEVLLQQKKSQSTWI